MIKLQGRPITGSCLGFLVAPGNIESNPLIRWNLLPHCQLSRQMVSKIDINEKWDEQSIDTVYEELLDSTGSLLDQVSVFGLDVLLGKKRYFELYLELVRELEKELLIQWKIKKEKGLSDLLARQCKWYRREVRKSRGVFSVWNRLYFQIQGETEYSGRKSSHDPWKTILAKDLLDLEILSEAIGKNTIHLPVLKKLCKAFEQLFQTNPYRLFVEFLNLTEIGIRFRPEIYSLKTDNVLSKSDIFGGVSFEIIGKGAGELLSTNSWKELPEMLVKFWKRKCCG